MAPLRRIGRAGPNSGLARFNIGSAADVKLPPLAGMRISPASAAPKSAWIGRGAGARQPTTRRNRSTSPHKREGSMPGAKCPPFSSYST